MPLDPHLVLNATFLICIVILIASVLKEKKYALPYQDTPDSSGNQPLSSLNLIGVGVILTFFATTMLAQQLAPAPDNLTREITPELLIINIIGQMFPAVIVLAILISQRISLVSFFGLRMAHSYRLLYIAPATVVITYLFMIILGALGYEEWLVQIFGQKIEVQQAVKIYQDADEIIIRGLLAFSVVIVAPVVEEIIFRGYIYKVTKRFTARIFSTVVSAVLFSVVHNYIPGLLPLAFLAILLTISYEMTGSLWAPISIHALFNASTLIVQEIHHHHQ